MVKVMNKLTVYRLIPEGMYKELTQKHNLTGIVKTVFSPLDNLDHYEYLETQLVELRQSLNQIQNEMADAMKKNPVINTLPLLFIRDTASRSGACYLRWRNLRNSKSGEYAWRGIITDPNQPDIVKSSLVQVEKERITINMQMAILAHIVKQLRECREKIKYIEDLAQTSGSI